IAGNAWAADRIDDGINAAAAGDLADALADLLALAVDDVIGAKLAGEARLGFAAYDADHVELRNLGQVDQRIAHAAGGRIDQHGLALARLKRIVEDVIGDLIIRQRRGGIERDTVRQQKSRPRRRRDIIRVMPAAM